MDLRTLFKRDLREVAGEVGSYCLLAYKGKQARVKAVVSDEQIADGGFPFAQANAITCSAQLDGDSVPFQIGVGATLTVDGHIYRVTSITRTQGDSAITLNLSVEGKQ